MAAELTRGHPERAIAAGRSAWHYHPYNVTVLGNLGILAADAGRYDLAVRALQQALGQAPRDPNMSASLAKVRLAQDRPGDALSIAGDALSEHPTDAELHFVSGNAFLKQARLADAVDCFSTAVTYQPDHGSAWANLGAIRQGFGSPTAAEAACREATRLMPDSSAAYNNLGNVLLAQDRAQEAADCYRRALEHDARAETYTNLGNALRDQGDLVRALESYRAALEISPESGEAWMGLASVKSFGPSDPDLIKLQSIVERGVAQDGTAYSLYYAAGRAVAKVGDRPADAFAYYAEGAKRKRATLSYAIEDDETEMAALARCAPSSLSGRSRTAARPIFIVGMPRSGTTLVEQILAAHDHIQPGGEQTALRHAARSLSAALDVDPPTLLREMDIATAGDLAERYVGALILDTLEGMTHFTDKMPTNFRWAGFIPAAFPDAKIIHVRRHPLDTCLSCFSRLFQHDKQRFSYDLDELGRFYRAYARLMAAWKPLFRADQFMEIWYEDLVTDFYDEVSRVLTFCDLPWREACLNFHETGRVIRTASSTQVRQPLYSSSLDAWREHMRDLAPLAHQFREDGLITADWRAVRDRVDES